MTPVPAPPPAHMIEIRAERGLWRVLSDDGLLSGVFVDRRSATRHARDEAESHCGYVLVVRGGPTVTPSSG